MTKEKKVLKQFLKTLKIDLFMVIFGFFLLYLCICHNSSHSTYKPNFWHVGSMWHRKGSSIYQLTPGGGVWAKVSSWCQQGGSGPSVSWQSRNLMVEAYHACFRPVIPLFRPTNCHFVIRWMIFTKNMIFIAKITRRKKSHWKMSRNVIRVKKIGAKSIFRHYF